MSPDRSPVEILLVEDNPGDVRLTMEAFQEAKVLNNVSVVGASHRTHAAIVAVRMGLVE